MIRTDPHSFALPSYSYARVEAALAAVFGVSAERRGPLKGRLKHLNTLGLPGLQVGRGVRIAYSLEQISQLLFALLIEEIGVDPTVVVRLIKEAWNSGVSDWARLAVSEESNANHVFLKMRPQLMTGPWVQEASPLASIRAIGAFQQSSAGLLNVEREVIGAVRDRKWICLRDLTADFEVLMASLEREAP